MEGQRPLLFRDLFTILYCGGRGVPNTAVCKTGGF